MVLNSDYWTISLFPMQPRFQSDINLIGLVFQIWSLPVNEDLDSEAMRARGIIVLVKSNWLVKNIETKQLKLSKRDSAAIVLVFKAGAFRY